MTQLLKDMLRDDYLNVIKIRMVENGHNNSSLAKATSFSVPHIGNILDGGGSDEALRTIISVLNLDLKSILKDEFQGYTGGAGNANQAINE
jgi:hypothetical protein